MSMSVLRKIMKELRPLILMLLVLVIPVNAMGISAPDLHAIDFDSAFYDPSACNPASDASSATDSSLSGSTVAQQVFNYLTQQVPMGAVPAAAFVGNFYEESGGIHPADPNGGIAQWNTGRLAALESLASAQGKPWTDLGVQLMFVKQELTGDKQSAFDVIKNDTDIGQATTDVMNLYEQPYVPTEHYGRRLAAAQDALNQYGGTAGASAGSPSLASSPTDPNGAGGCGGSCPQPTTTSNTIVLDPGHSPNTDPTQRDSITGLYVEDYENDPEMANAYTAATKIEALLQAKGYNVVLTKNSATDKLNLAERAARANAANPALVVTMHSTPGIDGFLMYPDDNSKREPAGSPRKDGTNGLVHPEIEAPSTQFAQEMAPIIAKGIGDSKYVSKSFYQEYGTNGLLGNGLNSGNTPVETILMDAPEVYSEVNQNVLPTDAFASAMTDAITKAVPLSAPGGTTGSTGPASSVSSSCSPSGTIQAAIQLAMEYSWPDGRQGLTMTPAYEAATRAAQANGEYVGGDGEPGIDCGAFITRVMRNSGADPNYNWGPHNPKQGYTVDQQAYLNAHPELYQNLGSATNVGELQPGDIAINSVHTFMYIGPQSDHPNFHGNAAMASLDQYAPTANEAYFSNSAGDFTWYRLIGNGSNGGATTP